MKPVRSVWLARHGDRLDFTDTEWTATAARPYDPPLSPLGREQAYRLALRLQSQGVSYIFSSPFLRAVETAAAVCKALRIPMRIEPGLSEWLNREWFPKLPETVRVDELWHRFPEIDRGYHPVGSAVYGETGDEALLRSGETAQRLTAAFPGTLLLVGHGASVLGATLGLLQAPVTSAGEVLPEISPASVVKLVYRHGVWRLALACDVAHLQ